MRSIVDSRAITSAASAGLRQCDFDVDVTLNQCVIGEQRAHFRGAESVAKQDGIDHGAGLGKSATRHDDLV
jgi:hypothetical protein